MTTTASKFGALRALRDETQEAKSDSKSEKRPARRRAAAPAPKLEETGAVGHPTGKRSNPNYRQVTGLIPRDVHFEVTKALLEERGGERGRDMGDLMTELFQNWLKARKH